jgi:hypothetical protein
MAGRHRRSGGGAVCGRAGVRGPARVLQLPPLNASAQRLSAYFLGNRSEVRALAFFHTLSALALIGFSVYLRTRLHQALVVISYLAGGPGIGVPLALLVLAGSIPALRN